MSLVLVPWSYPWPRPYRSGRHMPTTDRPQAGRFWFAYRVSRPSHSSRASNASCIHSFLLLSITNVCHDDDDDGLMIIDADRCLLFCYRAIAGLCEQPSIQCGARLRTVFTTMTATSTASMVCCIFWWSWELWLGSLVPYIPRTSSSLSKGGFFID